MKKIFFGIVSLLSAVTIFTSCHKLDVPVNTELTPDVFPKTESQIVAASGPVYIALRSDFAGSYWFSQSLTTDEAVLAAFGGNWLDGNRYLELHRHTWTKDNAGVSALWYYASNLIGVVNQTVAVLKDLPASQAKTTTIAEIKTVRALAYYIMLDNFGNVPLDTLYGDKGLKPTTPRAKVFEFVEKELKTNLPNLSTTTGMTTYGRPTQYFAYSLLAKLYLNAQVYTGTPRYNDCIAACDQVINSGLYGIEAPANYMQMFSPTNGPGQKEFIFAIPYDASTNGGNMIYARYDLNRNLGIRYLYSGSTPGGFTDPIMNQSKGNGLANNMPSGPRMTTAQFYANFNDPNDVRNKQWLTGPQYWQDGTPIMVATTKSGYDQFYKGSDGGSTYVYPLVITPLVDNGSRLGATAFDLGNDEIAWNTGIRNIKYLPDYTNTINRNQSNDVPVIRYSDILLMKAEAILRGGTPTLGATALSLVNTLRANRTTSAALTAVTLDDIYAERCRELSWETWHRNDMIRFGKYEGTWGLGKNNSDTYRRLFPIPTSAFQTNNTLTQNPGYN